MSDTIFGSPVAEVHDDLLLYYIVRHCPRDFPTLYSDNIFTWIELWNSCVEEAKYRGLLPLDGWEQWARYAV